MSSVVSVNVASRAQQLPGQKRFSGIYKSPVDRSVQVVSPGPTGTAGGGLVGDVVCDLKHHGGDDQAVYAYAREDLDWWATELGRELPNGCFGENLTTHGINVSQALIGEHWLLGGGLLLQVSDPRIPCTKFSAALGEDNWVHRFTARAAPGTYLRVLRPGFVQAGDSIVVVERPRHSVSVSLAFRALTTEPDLVGELTGISGLSADTAARVARRTAPVAGTLFPK